MKFSLVGYGLKGMLDKEVLILTLSEEWLFIGDDELSVLPFWASM
jgi:hypothetical protein